MTAAATASHVGDGTTPDDARALAALWRALGGVADPELPMVSVVELGIVRSVARDGASYVVKVTPTYSACPATAVIAEDMKAATATIADVRIETALAPPWTTDWIAPEARHKLRQAGIAPPHAVTARAVVPVAVAMPRVARVRCPQCGSTDTAELSRFGSTACKAQFRCSACLEPFDYFKPL